MLPFLAGDFAKGGVLEGKEVYAFSPMMSGQLVVLPAAGMGGQRG